MDTQIKLDCFLARGHILDMVITLESFMDYYISTRLTKDKMKTFLLSGLILTPRVPLESKKQIFFALTELFDPHFQTDKKVSRDFDTIIQTRNTFAHYPLSEDAEAMAAYEKTGELRFLKFKNVKEANKKDKNAPKETSYVTDIIFTPKDLKELRQLINEYIKKVQALTK